MAVDQGFLERLTGNDGDESAQATAFLNADKGSKDMATRSAAQGSGARPLRGAVVGAVKGLFTGHRGDEEKGGRSIGGIVENLVGGFQDEKDRRDAEIHGITPEELKSRRAIRKDLSGGDFARDGSIEDRMKMARRAAAIANEHGDGAGVARALQSLSDLRTEKGEFDKLQANVKSLEAEAIDDGIKTAWRPDGTPVTGVQAIGPDGLAGLEYAGPNGKLIFEPYSANLTRDDPQKPGSLANEPDDVRIRKLVSKEERKVIKNLASSANAALRISDRVLSTLFDLAKEGGVESVIGTSGGIITSIDNFARNINGVIDAFAGAGKSRSNDALRSSLRGKADDAGHFLSSLIELPEGVEATSAAAQQHRANIMEMAYMAARLAEPSNRGLSDNDIKNALARIAGGTSNPQVMVRRFLEMQVDAANQLDFALRLHHGSLGPNVSDQRIDLVLGGKGIPEYRERKQAFFDKFGVNVSPDGRVIFEEGRTIGADVNPGEGVLPEPEAEPLDDAAFLEAVTGVPMETPE